MSTPFWLHSVESILIEHDINLALYEQERAKGFKEHFAEMSFYSPAGEDFSFTIIYDREVGISSFIQEIQTYWEDFDPSERASMWYGQNRGEPNDIGTLYEDARAIEGVIKDALLDLENWRDFINTYQAKSSLTFPLNALDTKRASFISGLVEEISGDNIFDLNDQGLQEHTLFELEQMSEGRFDAREAIGLFEYLQSNTHRQCVDGTFGLPQKDNFAEERENFIKQIEDLSALKAQSDITICSLQNEIDTLKEKNYLLSQELRTYRAAEHLGPYWRINGWRDGHIQCISARQDGKSYSIHQAGKLEDALFEGGRSGKWILEASDWPAGPYGGVANNEEVGIYDSPIEAIEAAERYIAGDEPNTDYGDPLPPTQEKAKAQNELAAQLIATEVDSRADAR